MPIDTFTVYLAPESHALAIIYSDHFSPCAFVVKPSRTKKVHRFCSLDVMKKKTKSNLQKDLFTTQNH